MKKKYYEPDFIILFVNVECDGIPASGQGTPGNVKKAISDFYIEDTQKAETHSVWSDDE